MGKVNIRLATREEFSKVAEVFRDAFDYEIIPIFGDALSPELHDDIYQFLFIIIDGQVVVSDVDGEIVGYVMAPQNISKIPRGFIVNGYVFKLIWRWMKGRYGKLLWSIGIKNIGRAIKDKVGFLRPQRKELNVSARILSIGVKKRFRGRGFGQKILNYALENLRMLGSEKVRLEVRPWNSSARHVYEKAGFEYVGQMSDSQGEWLVMVKDMGGGV